MTKQTIILFLSLSLLSSILSTALTSSEQINPSFGEKTKDKKPKETKTKSKSKSKDEYKTKADSGTKGDDSKPKETDNKETTSKESDTKDSSSKAPTSPPTDNQQTDNALPLQQQAAAQRQVVTTDNQLTGSAPTCYPPSQSCPPTTPITNPNDIMQQPCDPTIEKCPPIDNLAENTQCPADFHMGSDGLCHIVSCDLPKEKCPPPCDLKKGECSTGIKCNPNYHRGSDGLCHIVNSDCDLPKEKCPPPICDLFKKNVIGMKNVKRIQPNHAKNI